MEKIIGKDIKCIVFDMDGVIVDTEYHSCMELEKFIKIYNPDIRWCDLSCIVGASSNHFFELLKGLMKVDDTVETIKTLLYDYMENYAKKIDYMSMFRKDIIQILNYAKKNNIALGVASSSEMITIKEVLECCEISSYFDCILSGKECSQSKPHPEIYIEILNQLNVAVENSLVIEDSSYGILAAKKAGLAVVAYEDNRLGLNQNKADYIRKNMTEVLELIEQMVNNEKSYKEQNIS